MRKLTTEEFIEKAKLIHGDDYDYSKVDYENFNKKIIIICKECNKEFFQTPHNHLNNHGCQFCGGTKLSNTEDFILKAKLIHGDDYDYSKVIYIKNYEEVIIICKVHNKEFLQEPLNHLSGKGCSDCGGTKLSNTEEFILKAINVHGKNYNYSKTDYKNNRIKVIIICKIHNLEFFQNPGDHLNGKGCPECGGRLKSNTEEFIEKAKLIHGNIYNYSKTVYDKSNKKVIIICKKHNKEFSQRPDDHLQGRGCPKCLNVYKQNKWLDSIGIPDDVAHRDISFRIDKKLFKPDGFDSLTKTVYEFYGDFWHGNPNIYKPEDINLKSKKTYGELYRETIERENILKENGYNIISIWENEFDRIKWI